MVRKLYKLIVPKKIKDFISKYRYGHRRISLGEDNPDKTFFVLQNIAKHTGICSNITVVLRNIMYANKMNYITIVDQFNRESQYHDKIAFGKDNAWEYYFEQPCGYDLQDISKSKNIIICKSEDGHEIDFFRTKNVEFELIYFEKNPNGRILEYKKYFRKYIKFNKKAQEKIDCDYNKVLKGKGKILGVVGRGAEFFIKKPKNHRIMPQPKVLIEKAIEAFYSHNFDYIYLATEDKNIYNIFKEQFGEKLLDNGQRRVEGKDFANVNYISEINFNNEEKEKYNLGLDYLSSVCLLSKCNGLMGGVCNATIVAYIMSEGFEYEYFFDLGIYR